MEKDWVKLTAVVNAQKAEIMRSLLESEGIPAVVINKRDTMYAVLACGEVELYCHAENALRALEILENNMPL
jgi:hypothetical protein